MMALLPQPREYDHDDVLPLAEPAVLVAGLIGVSLGMLLLAAWAGLQRMFASAETTPPASAVLTGLLVATGLGLWLPRRLAFSVCAMLWHLKERDGDNHSRPNRHASPAHSFSSRAGRAATDNLPAGGQFDLFHLGRAVAVDRPVHWTMMGMIALLAGLMSASTPLLLRLARAALDFLLANFVWPPVMLSVLAFLFGLAVGLPALALLGLAATSAHRLGCKAGQWQPRATAGLLIGAGVGGMLAFAALDLMATRPIMLALVSLPVLVVALLAASFAGPDHVPEAVDNKWRTLLPTWSDRWPRTLRGGILLAGVTAVWVLALWLKRATAGGTPPALLVSATLMPLGLGFWLGCQVRRHSPRTIGGFGVAAGVTGATVAAMLHLDAGWSREVWWLSPLLLSLSLASIGFAVAYGQMVLLHRVAEKASIGIALLARIVIVGAISYWLLLPWTVRWVGEAAALAAAALSLLALGGTLIIHDPAFSPRTRRIRLAFIFAAVGAMIALAPTAALRGQAHPPPDQRPLEITAELDAAGHDRVPAPVAPAPLP